MTIFSFSLHSNAEWTVIDVIVFMMAQEPYNILHAVMTLGDAEVHEMLRTLAVRDTPLAYRALLNKRGMYGETPLMAAVLLRSTRTVSIMIDGGADVNAQDSKGTTSLMLAAVRGNIRTINALLDAGAKLESRDNCGDTALMYSIQASRGEVVELLMELKDSGSSVDGYGQTELLAAYEDLSTRSLGNMMIRLGMYRDMKIIKQCLLRQRFDVMTEMVKESLRRRDSCNLANICKSILLFTCGCGTCCQAERERIKRAIEVFANLGCFDRLSHDILGDIFLHAAMRADLTTLVQVHTLVRDASSSLNIIDYHAASSQGNTALMRILKQLYAWIDSGERVAIEVKKGMAECMRYLIDCDADMTVEDEDGLTPLHYAVYSTDIDTVKCMIDHCTTRIRSLHWKTFTCGEPCIRHHRNMLTKAINISTVDITSDSIPWACGCCTSCNTRAKREMQEYIWQMEGGLPSRDAVWDQSRPSDPRNTGESQNGETYIALEFMEERLHHDSSYSSEDDILDDPSDTSLPGSYFENSSDEEEAHDGRNIVPWWIYLVRN